MVSAALTFLRTVPAQQAAIYNGYMPKASAVRQDVYSTGASKLAQISALVQDARNALRTLQDRANTAESQVRAAAVPQSSPDDLAVVEARKHDIRWAFEHGISLPGVCQQFVATGDRDGFTALHALLPWLVRASLVGRSESGPAQGMDTAAYKRALADAEEQIAGFERQVLSAAELAVLDELREVEHSMPWVRNNFAQLARFFDGQTSPAAIQGAFQRVDQLAYWQGLPGDNQPKGLFGLGDDFGGKYKPAPNVPSTAELEAGKQFDPSTAPMLVTGGPSAPKSVLPAERARAQ